MTAELIQTVTESAQHFEGYVYPNEIHLLWSILIVVYPYVTGLVAGAFILASLVRVFKVHALEPVYRLSLLTSFSFLLAAPLPLLFHLGHPERCLEVMMTPHVTSPMAMFGFVYAWYLMAVLLLELWFDYRRDFVKWAETEGGIHGTIYRLFTLGVDDISEPAIRLDDRLGKIITVIGIPSAFLLHGYVGFIFGSIKANPWWGNVLMPIIFIFSAMVSGIALCVVLYMTINWARRVTQNIECLDMMAKFLFYALVIDASIEGLDWIHRLYAADESIDVLKTLASGRLFYTLLVGQACLGTARPAPVAGSGANHPKAPPDPGAGAHLLRQRDPHHARRARDALERGHRRSAFLQEPSRVHNLQDGIGRAGRMVDGTGSDPLALLHPRFLAQVLPAAEIGARSAPPQSCPGPRVGLIERRSRRLGPPCAAVIGAG